MKTIKDIFKRTPQSQTIKELETQNQILERRVVQLEWENERFVELEETESVENENDFQDRLDKITRTIEEQYKEKIRKLKRLAKSDAYRGRIEVDGGIDAENLSKVLDAGADIIVAGSAIFNREDAAEAVLEMKKIAGQYNKIPEIV